MKHTKRTALLIHCSVEEAEKIRASAKREHRTISGHVLAIVMRQIELKEQLQRQHYAALRKKGVPIPEDMASL